METVGSTTKKRSTTGCRVLIKSINSNLTRDIKLAAIESTGPELERMKSTGQWLRRIGKLSFLAGKKGKYGTRVKKTEST
jgi:hypothetical protein